MSNTGRVILVPVGSYGDVNPYVGVGRAMQARGHEVVVMTNGYFRGLVEGAGLSFVEIGSAEEYLAVTASDRLFHPRRGIREILVWGAIAPMRDLYAEVKARYLPGRTVVAGAGIAFGARLAHEHLGVPYANLHLQPMAIPSYEAPPVPPFLQWTVRLPAWCLRAATTFMSTVIDYALAGPVRRFRRELGLPTGRHYFLNMPHSPQRIVGMFPPWFGPPAPDWPTSVRLASFPFYDGADVHPLSEDVQAFLDAGDPPIVFTPGTAMRHAKTFFENSVEHCAEIGRRGILLTRHSEQLPAQLPDGVRHFAYAPFGPLLPRCAAIVHHGGIGTTAQAMRAGIGQLIVPWSFDQPDNAARVVRLGAGATVEPRHYGRRGAERLGGLFSPETQSACAKVSRLCRADDGIAMACDLLDALIGKDGAPASP